MSVKHAHCSWCGAAFAADQRWPRTCAGCTQISYINPIPVTVVLLPVDDGLLCVRRGIPPGLGKLALPGGYLDFHETWQQGAVREVFEETGIRIGVEDIELVTVLSPPPGDGLILIFGQVRPHRASELPPFVPNEEVTEVVVVREAIDLAFPLHNEVVRRFFASRRSGTVTG